jgi:hypothetical protein
MKEGPINEPSYYFPGNEITRYLTSLPDSDYFEDIILDTFGSQIVVMTHDDTFDCNMRHFESDNGYSSTWFIDVTLKHEDVFRDLNTGIHFNKEKGILKDQVKIFKDIFGKAPKFNRNHRLLIRSKNLDFPFLAMYGIQIDSTLIGDHPFIPVISGKVIPIIEFPFSISDGTTRTMCLYNVAKSIELPFKKSKPLITVNAHPFDICKQYDLTSCYYEVIKNAEKYGYQIIDLEKIRALDYLLGYV